MNSKSKALSRAAISALFLLVVFVASPVFGAQTKQLMTWNADLNYLKSVPNEDLMVQRSGIEQIRDGVELYIKMHPSTKVELAPAPAKPWDVEVLKKQVAALHQAVQAILKEDTGQPFDLGSTTISVTSEASPLSPITETFSRTEIQNLQALTVGTALDYMPGLALDRSDRRNEAGIRLRGFSNRGQIPLYLDGIPIQVPYDGSLDFQRFLTSDIAEIQVAKGYSSPLLGANNLGGSINLVTREPQKKFEGDALIGTGSGSQLLSSFRLGSRWQQFYFQGSFDWLQRDFIPLSGNFPLQTPITPSPRYQTTYERNRSDSRDQKFSGRIAWTPNDLDRYVFSYVNQKGEKGNPLYAGPNLNASNRYWDWPYWNKTSYYFLTNTELGESSSIKLRAFYDKFGNALSSFDSDSYTTMNTGRAFFSVYDDHSHGASAEFTTRILPRNTMGASFSYKDDSHEAYDHIPRQSVIQTPLFVRSQTFSIGYQDVITITSKLRATFGFSADYLKGLRGQQRRTNSNTILLPLSCEADPTNDSFSGCTPHVWTFNPQVSLSYSVSIRDTLFVTFSDRGRFPLLSESYSTKFNAALQNPDLKPEHSRNWNIGYSHSFPKNTVGQIEFFRSDLRDAIHSVYVTDPGNPSNRLCSGNNGTSYDGYCLQNVNIAKEMHEGFEISLRSSPISRLTLDANYTYINRSLDYRFADMPDVSKILTTIDKLASLPKNKVIFNATGELPHKILAIFSYRYEGGLTFQDTTYSANAPLYGSSHGVVDLGAVIPTFAGVSLQAGIKNLFDRDYYYSAGYPEAGRSWYFNMRYKF